MRAGRAESSQLVALHLREETTSHSGSAHWLCGSLCRQDRIDHGLGRSADRLGATPLVRIEFRWIPVVDDHASLNFENHKTAIWHHPAIDTEVVKADAFAHGAQ